MDTVHRDVTLPDGRHIEVIVGGDAGRPAILFHHGCPGAAAGWESWTSAADRHELRWVSISRPGHGGSDRSAGRSVADPVADVEHILDELGIDSYVAVGWSGGGPSALGCGALSTRCDGAVLMAAIAPWQEMNAAGADFTAGMAEVNVAQFTAAEAGESNLEGLVRPVAAMVGGLSAETVGAAFGPSADTPADRRALQGPFAAELAESVRESVRTGIGGWMDDFLSLAKPWGVDLATVPVPVSVWHGEIDKAVPVSHGRFLIETLPQVSEHVTPEDGHLSIVVDHVDEVVAEAAAMVSATSRG